MAVFWLDFICSFLRMVIQVLKGKYAIGKTNYK